MGDPDDELEAARVLKCTACGAAVDVCSVCRLGFLATQAVSCRRDEGHDHATCATRRMRKLASDAPSSERRGKR